jgi:hypothetical protein
MQRRNGSFVLTFWVNLSVPSSRVKLSFWTVWPLKVVPIGCAKKSVWNYHSTLRKIQKERRSHLCRGGSLKSRTDKASSVHLHDAWCHLRRYSVIYNIFHIKNIFCPRLTRGTAILTKRLLTSLHHSRRYTSKQALFLPKLPLHIHLPKVIQLKYQFLYISL